ncbi:unnamed protein product [Chrysoparadoxa australica]
MDSNLYDEFGNYIGPELDESSAEEESESEEEDEGAGPADEGDGMDVEASEAIVLHEDKKYYPDASAVFGDASAVVLDEDAQAIEEPLIAPVKTKTFSTLEKTLPDSKCSPEFIATLMETPGLIRNVAVVGALHHGKTALVDMLVSQTRVEPFDVTKEVRYTDSRDDEQQRCLSIKSCPVSLALESTRGKHFLLNVIDCPGHINFAGECTAAMGACDGVIVSVDAIEGVLMSTERLIKQALSQGLSLTLVINKVDRLILELKLPPRDAYFKLIHTLDEVNSIVRDHNLGHGQAKKHPRLCPKKGNVCFASAQHNWCFSLSTFAKSYCDFYGNVDEQKFARRLWGDLYVEPSTGAFVTQQPQGYEEDVERTFIQFILDPLYKMYSQILGEDSHELTLTLKQLGVKMQSEEFYMDPKPLLKLILGRFFGHVGGVVDMVVAHVPSPQDAATDRVARNYTGALDSSAAIAMSRCDPLGPLMMHVVKLYSTPDGQTFNSFGRIYSGSVRLGQKVKVMGEGYSPEDDEDMVVCEVAAISAPQGRHTMDLSMGKAGNWVMLEGVDASINKTATIADAEGDDDVAIFAPLRFDMSAVMKLAVEPLNPAELPKMVEGLRKIGKSYPLALTKVEESGEHIVYGTGELMLDCVMHDLRHMYAEIEVKVADPSTAFCETVVETSALKCFSETPNKKNKLTMIAEPLDEGLAQDIQAGEVKIGWERKTLGKFFQEKYDWDLLAARSVWAFGPDIDGPNVLLDDTLPSEVDKAALLSIKDSIVQGFKWGCREGPLCDEPLRSCKFKILDSLVAGEAIHRGGGQIIPTARRVIYSSFLMASPRLLEPVYALEIQAPADMVSSVYPVLQKRRGHVVQDAPKAGAPFYTIKAFLPVIDSFGFETDLRSYTQGQAFCSQVFDHWSIVPGDPLDKSIVLHPLEPSPPPHLAREFMVKTRRRKGLSEDVSINKYFDDPMLLEIAATNV